MESPEPPTTRTNRRNRILVAMLAVATVVTSIGWFLAAREGRGIPVECYRLDADFIGFDAIHGNNTHRSTFAVAESDDEVMLGYWEDSDDSDHSMMGYDGTVRYLLVEPLGDREVVDPAGEPIPRC